MNYLEDGDYSTEIHDEQKGDCIVFVYSYR